MSAKLFLSTPFLQDLALLDPAFEERVWRELELVQSFPGVGSSLVEPLLVQAFGASVLKVAVGSYDVIYERIHLDDGSERVNVLGIIPQRKIR